jgi:hypothetical protein
MMKVIFVGVHNKPDTNPLCIFTKTGKLLQRVIDQLPGVEFEKTNLLDIDHFPNDQDDTLMLARDWAYRISPDYDDIIILLGAIVQKWFQFNHDGEVLHFGHPSGVWSKIKQEAYVKRMVQEIRDCLPIID